MKRLIIPVAAWLVIAPSLVSVRPARADDAPPAPAAADAPPQRTEFPQGVLFPHFYLDNALDGKVNKNGMVDYAGLKDDKNLAHYLRAVAGADLTQFPVWPIQPAAADKDSDDAKPDKDAKPALDRSAEVVFWINAYNAHVLKTLSDAYPIDSPDDIKDFDKARTHRVAGKDYSLQEMRAYIAKLDPRALFALTDGTLGGPLLASMAYRFADIDAALDHAAATFVSDSRNVQVLRIANKVTVSDFFVSLDSLFTPAGTHKKYAGIRAVLIAYSNQHSDRSYMTTGDYQITVVPRDRHLNVQSKD